MPFCTQCGQQVADADVYCASCGKPQTATTGGPSRPSGGSGSAPRYASGPSAPAHDPLANLSPRTAAILCYLPVIGWVPAVVVLTAQKFRGDKIVRFHAFQGLYLFAAWLVVQWLIQPLTRFSGRSGGIEHALEGILLGVWIFMIIKTSHNDSYVLPIIGELAQRSAADQ